LAGEVADFKRDLCLLPISGCFATDWPEPLFSSEIGDTAK
jgi:hypothetical protein